MFLLSYLLFPRTILVGIDCGRELLLFCYRSLRFTSLPFNPIEYVPLFEFLAVLVLGCLQIVAERAEYVIFTCCLK